jgi:hydrogenase/urease accessory protein HupE
MPAATAVSLVVVGALVAWSPRLRDSATAALAAVVGGFHGYLNGSLRAAGGIELEGVIGVAATVFVLAALAAALAASLRGATSRIVVRVAGSWIAAIGLLLLGWSLRPGV